MVDETYESLMERAKREFDFKKWRVWLQAKAAELQGAGLETSCRFGPDDGSKP